MGRKNSAVRGGWYQGVDGQWYLTERPPAPGWVIGPDQRWGPPPPKPPAPPKTKLQKAVPWIIATVVLVAFFSVSFHNYGRRNQSIVAAEAEAAAAPATSIEVGTAPPPTPPPATFASTVLGSEAISPVTRVVYINVTNIGPVAGVPSCSAAASDVSYSYKGFNAATGPLLQPGQDAIVQIPMTITNEGALWATEATGKCS